MTPREEPWTFRDTRRLVGGIVFILGAGVLPAVGMLWFFYLLIASIWAWVTG